MGKFGKYFCIILNFFDQANPYLLLAMGLSISLHCMILYVDIFNVVFNISALSFDQWLVVMKFSAPVLLVDEALKFIARNYTDGKGVVGNMFSSWREGLAIVASFVAYGYYWYISLVEVNQAIL